MWANNLRKVSEFLRLKSKWRQRLCIGSNDVQDRWRLTHVTEEILIFCSIILYLYVLCKVKVKFIKPAKWSDVVSSCTFASLINNGPNTEAYFLTFTSLVVIFLWHLVASGGTTALLINKHPSSYRDFCSSAVLFSSFYFCFLSCKLADMLYSFQTFEKQKSCIVYTSWKYDPLLARCTFSFFSQSRLFLFFSFKCFHSESFLSPQLCGPAVH